MKQDLSNYFRIPLLILGMVSLVVGTLAGIARMGWSVPGVALEQIPHHGVLMIPAFFGAVIGLERAVAIGKHWAYAGPLLSGLGGVALIAGLAPQYGYILALLGSLLFVAASIQVLKVQRVLHNWILLSGAVALLVGNLLLIWQPDLRLPVLWWMVFLVLTIAGERLELSRLVVRSEGKRQGLALLCALTFLAAPVALFSYSTGELVVALSMLGIALWLIAYDIARRTIHQTGLPRFTAVCMLTGYAWLLCCALLLILENLNLIGITRDAPLHALFLGFVFSMVLGHALIIFPAVTRLKIPYSPLFYAPLLFLHLTLLLRMIGSLGFQAHLYTLGGLLNALALALFIAAMIYSVIRAARSA